MSRWLVPVGASRAGAAHRRAGRPCQDAVLCRELQSAEGQPVMVMAVADGHGGSRYRRSEVGSRLACAIALAVVQEELAARPLGSAGSADGDWSRWLERDLPEAIQRRWLLAVEADWQKDPEDDGFQPLLYGSTLGLVVMTARWWGHTGLGDWDLVRVERNGRAQLLQEEDEATAAGEATCSLCQPQAAALFARRAGLHPLAAAAEEFALVLCTDGIRKSCATDADFLTLAAWLARCPADAALGEEPESARSLPAALDRISREGSGDDVTVAIACCGSAPPPARDSEAGQARGFVRGSGSGRSELQPAFEHASASQAASASEPVSASEPTAAFAAAPARGPLRQPLLAGRRRPAFGRAVAIGLGLAAAGAGVLALLWPSSGPLPPPATTSAGLAAARREVERLCSQPAVIPLELRRRRELFVALRQGRQDPTRLKAAAASDPLAALIAADLPPPPASPPPPSPQLPSTQPDRPPAPAPAPPRLPLRALGACPALLAALDRQWALTPARSPSLASAAPIP